MYEYMGTGMGFYGLIPLSLMVLIIYIVFSSQKKDSKTPLEILKERYAKGEIDQQEFDQKRNELQA